MRRRLTSADDAAPNASDGDEDGAESFGDEGARHHKRELRSALGTVESAVRSAFEGGRTPGQGDVDKITLALQATADAVLVGRMALGVKLRCTHSLSPFLAPVDGYTCGP